MDFFCGQNTADGLSSTGNFAPKTGKKAQNQGRIENSCLSGRQG
jgi:hypothetical protein